MDQFASNTLRTLGIVVVSIFVILGSLALLLLALCFGLIGGLGNNPHRDPQTLALIVGALAAAAVLVTVGVLVVGKLAKGMVRESALPPLRWNIPDGPNVAATSTPTSAVPLSTLQSTAQPPTVVSPPPLAQQTTDEPHRTRDVVTHLSPASRTTVRQLIFAIVAQIVSQVIPMVLGQRWTQSVRGPFRPPWSVTSLWLVASGAPYLVLLFSLVRRRGRRAFAYALAIPSIQILYGIFGSSTLIFVVFRGTHSATSFLILIPWALHVLILYLAWKAIRLTGICPNPARIIGAAAVVFFYYFLLPVLLVFLRYQTWR